MLRRPGEAGYKLPTGPLFSAVACPNYAGEALEWLGWALAARGALPQVAFAAFTAANLGPRARAHLDWYARTFPGAFPPGKAAFVPWLY